MTTIVNDHRTLACTCGLTNCTRIVHLGLIDGVEHAAIEVGLRITTPWTPIDEFGVQGEWLYGPDSAREINALAHLDGESVAIFERLSVATGG